MLGEFADRAKRERVWHSYMTHGLESPRGNQLEAWVQAKRVMEAMDEHTRSKHFTMERWLVTTQCGTVGCVAGHCALDPWFQDRGLDRMAITSHLTEPILDSMFGRMGVETILTGDYTYRATHAEMLDIIDHFIEWCNKWKEQKICSSIW